MRALLLALFLPFGALANEPQAPGACTCGQKGCEAACTCSSGTCPLHRPKPPPPPPAPKKLSP